MKKKKHTFITKSKRHRFGEILVSKGTIKPEQLEEALSIQREEGGILGWIMVEKGFITESEVVRTLGEQFNLPLLRLKNFDIDADLISFFPEKFLYVNLIVPLCEYGEFILVCVADIPDDNVIEKLEEKGKELVVYISSVTDVSNTLKQHAPVEENDRREYISLRRKKLRGEYSEPVGGVDEQAESSKQEESGEQDTAGETEVFSETAATAEETALFANLDNAWESVFDEAEENLKSENS